LRIGASENLERMSVRSVLIYKSSLALMVLDLSGPLFIYYSLIYSICRLRLYSYTLSGGIFIVMMVNYKDAADGASRIARSLSDTPLSDILIILRE
jgi:hypothetical protein